MADLSVELQLRIRTMKTAIPKERQEEFIALVLDVAEAIGRDMYRGLISERKRLIDANLRTLLR